MRPALTLVHRDGRQADDTEQLKTACTRVAAPTLRVRDPLVLNMASEATTAQDIVLHRTLKPGDISTLIHK